MEQKRLPGNLKQLQESRKAMGEALEKEVALGFRITLRQPSSRSKRKECTVILQFPEQIKAAWRGADPTHKAKLSVDSTDDTAVFTWDRKNKTSREAFVVVQGNAADIFSSMTAQLMIDGETVDFQNKLLSTPRYDGRETILSKVLFKSHKATISYAFLPIPDAKDLELDAFDDEVSEELKILGYME